MSFDFLDDIHSFSKKRQILSAALFLHEDTKEGLEARLGPPLPIDTPYDRIRYYDVIIEDWTITLTFLGEDPYELHDLMGERQGDDLIYTWKHVPIKILKQLAERLGAQVSDVRTRFTNR